MWVIEASVRPVTRSPPEEIRSAKKPARTPAKSERNSATKRATARRGNRSIADSAGQTRSSTSSGYERNMPVYPSIAGLRGFPARDLHRRHSHRPEQRVPRRTNAPSANSTGYDDRGRYLNTTRCVPAGTGTPTKLGASICGFTGSPSTVAVQRGEYDSFSITHAGSSAVHLSGEAAVGERDGCVQSTAPGGPVYGASTLRRRRRRRPSVERDERVPELRERAATRGTARITAAMFGVVRRDRLGRVDDFEIAARVAPRTACSRRASRSTVVGHGRLAAPTGAARTSR